MSERGFALVALMLVLGAGAIGVAVAIGSLRTITLADQRWRAERRLANLACAAGVAFRRDGAFPSSIDALRTARIIDPDGVTTIDPFEGTRALDYRQRGTPRVLTLRSTGPDRRLRTADDMVATADSQTLGRARVRNRLRILRALYLRSQYMDAPSMSSAERAAMRAALRTWSLSQRALLWADTAARPGLVATRDAAMAEIDGLRTSYGLPAVPRRATGRNGLCGRLGVPDAVGRDGFGRVMLTASVGFQSSGGDGRRNTDDDL
jgi:hypothetical protein